MASNKMVPARSLALYADGPKRFCSLRGQIGKPGSSEQVDDDATVGAGRSGGLLGFLVVTGLILIGLAFVPTEAFAQLDLPVPPQPVTAFGAAGVGVLLIGLTFYLGWRRRRLRATDQLLSMFGFKGQDYSVAGAGVFGNYGWFISADGLSAVPHVVFKRQTGHRSYHVGLLLPRPYSGKVHDADLFRLTLHMGILKRTLKVPMVTGSIRYANKLVKIAYSDSLYRSLVRMIPEYERSVKRWWPENRFNLRERQEMAAKKTDHKEMASVWPSEFTV